ncbi:MAG: pyridoxal 5'-phosphate synthase glutaminase subunit PdxT [bacterium]|nr:pyridoxal 5'-phosphate synthase glutaminase subunit PdxT [bacterium]
MKKIGILSYQGTVAEHKKALSKIEGVKPVEVKTLEALNSVDALIIPGGESTTISKLLNIFGLMEPLRRRIESGMPVWGTCAGLILLAKEIEGEAAHLKLMDISVKRNAFGRQLDSFYTSRLIPRVDDSPLPLVFIRAPLIKSVSKDAEILCEIDGNIVAAKQNNMLATSFHPEFTDDLRMHKYFIDMIKE